MATSDSYIPSLYVEGLAGSAKQRRLISKEMFRSAVALSEASADFLTCAGAIVASYLLQLHLGAPVQVPIQKVVEISLVHGLFAMLLLQRDGTYGRANSLLRIRETERAARTSIQSLLPLSAVVFLLKLNFPIMGLLISLGLSPALLVGQKQMLSSIFRTLHTKGYGIDRVVVYGKVEAAKRISSSLLYSPQFGLSPVAVVADESNPAASSMVVPGCRRYYSVPVQAGPITAAMLKSLRCNLLIVAMRNASLEKLTESIAVARQAGATVTFLPVEEEESPWTERLDSDGLPSASTIGPIVPWHHALIKRAMDIAGSSLLILLLSPFLILIAFLIRISSSGPALFVQKRAGRNGELFNMYKFRSMYNSAPKYEVSPTRSSDPRITRIGRILRRTSLDELPQLFNVLLGNMSLIGPRPEMPFIVERYNTQQRRRLQATPGITGLWQLSADRAFPIHENIEYDLYYIENRTFFMDVAILIHTLLFAAWSGI